MIDVDRACRPAPALAHGAIVVPALVLLLAGCAASGPPPPVQMAGSPRYACPDGRSFTRQFDENTHQTDLFLSGGAPHRLDPVPDPMGGVLYQDADYQLRTGTADAALALTDRSTTTRQVCTRGP